MKKNWFAHWLVEQTGRDDPTGDFARDAVQDAACKRLRTHSAWASHLEAHEACAGARAALDAAWAEFVREMPQGAGDDKANSRGK